ncbi:MAG: hypothetical protein QG608_3536 [Actinomycetota bacterium]|nr:hypothetical protein [Actinomycetota bacterium]
MAIVALVLSLIGGSLISLGLAIASIVRIRRKSYKGKGIAITAIVFSVLGTIFWTLVGLGLWVLNEDNALINPKVGDCIKGAPAGTYDDMKKVECKTAHTSQIFAVFDLPAGPYDASMIEGKAESECRNRRPTDLVGMKVDDLGVVYVAPDKTSWTIKDHEVTCFFVAPERTLTASLLP